MTPTKSFNEDQAKVVAWLREHLLPSNLLRSHTDREMMDALRLAVNIETDLHAVLSQMDDEDEDEYYFVEVVRALSRRVTLKREPNLTEQQALSFLEERGYHIKHPKHSQLVEKFTNVPDASKGEFVHVHASYPYRKGIEEPETFYIRREDLFHYVKDEVRMKTHRTVCIHEYLRRTPSSRLYATREIMRFTSLSPVTRAPLKGTCWFVKGPTGSWSDAEVDFDPDEYPFVAATAITRTADKRKRA